MTKRFGDPSNSSCKKPKLDDLDDLWGDDLDEDAIDNCIKLATQVCEQKVTTSQNDTILPTYDTFKMPMMSVMSSTQVQIERSFTSHVHFPTENGSNFNSRSSAEVQQRCCKKCEEKEGEVTILRNQLKEFKTKVQVDQQQKQLEWKERLSGCQKEVNTIKSQLEFKNLEIANLKQKMGEITKYNLDVSINSANGKIQSKNSTISKRISSEKEAIKLQHNHKLRLLLGLEHPLLKSHILPQVFDNKLQEKYIIETKSRSSSRNTIPYLQNEIPSEEIGFLKCLNLKSNGEDRLLSLEYIHSDITRIFNSTFEELNSRHSRIYLNKIIYVTIKLLNGMHHYLEQLISNCQSEDIQQLDSMYVTGSFNKLDESRDQIGIKAGKCVLCVAVILLYSGYLEQYILISRPLELDDDVEYKKYIDKTTLASLNQPFYFMETLCKIITRVGQLRKAHLCSGFLISVTKLLSNISKMPSFINVHNLFFKIAKEILFSRPTFNVIESVIILYKNATQCPTFVDSLCKRPSQATIKVILRRGLLHFNDDSCLFHVFVVLVSNLLMYGKQVVPSVCSNILCLAENMLQSNCYWLHHQERRTQCECLDQFYKLIIEIVYKTVSTCKEEYKNDTLTETHRNLLKSSVKVLSLLAFNSIDLIDKYITVYFQYKEVVHYFMQFKETLNLEDCDLEDLEKLNIYEDMPTIHSSKILF